jgi:hypothetical protein|nr:MAG TPA: hypothetical protein [Caudoviricetes sp.]
MTQDNHKKNWLSILCVLLFASVALNVWLYVGNRMADKKTSTKQSVDVATKIDTAKDVNPQPTNEKQVGVFAVSKSNFVKQGKCGKLSAKSMIPHDSASNYAETFPQQTIHCADSVFLPITQKTYHKDSSYTAWVSGYCPNLDSIHVYNRTIIKTITITKSKKEKRFGVGLQAGYGFGKNGATPYIGVGVQYRLF